jgi:hypothetical protein
MPALTASDVLRLWEIGVSQTPARRALTILQAAAPAASASDLWALPVGRRDRRLLEVRQNTFGAELDAVLACPACAERVEFRLDTSALLDEDASVDSATESEVAVDDWRVRYRMPTAGDLADAATCDDVAQGVRLLVERCVVDVTRRGEQMLVTDAPAAALGLMDAELAHRDALAEVLLDFDCPTCGSAGQAPFDIARYLWEEIRAEAARLVREVHTLARAYGWREADVLAMSAARRHAYLELVAS